MYAAVRTGLLATFLLAWPLTNLAVAADWPCYGADAARTSSSAEQLAFPLNSIWAYHPIQTPAPAWPEPGREQHRLDFDYAFQPVVAGGMVFFASSADDTVRALALTDGRLKWQFTAGGPIRFAPAWADGSLYVASDDGTLSRLDANTGAVQWRFRAAPEGRQMLGNGRMISRWPCRSGALVIDGVVYVTAGMWPSEGIYIYALNAATGKPIWKNDTSGALYRNQPHMGSSAFTGVCPQGYLLASKDLLLVPSGRTTPAALDRQTGKLVYYQPYLYQLPYDPEGWGNRGNGGAWALLAGKLLLSPMHQGGAPDIDIELGESGPRDGDGLVAYSLGQGLRVQNLPNRHRALVAGGRLFAAGNRQLEAFDLTLDQCGIQKTARWSASMSDERPYSMAASQGAILIGGKKSIGAFHADNGSLLWSSPADGQVRGLAIADGRLMITTSRGTIECFAPAKSAEEPVAESVTATAAGSALGPHVDRLSVPVEPQPTLGNGQHRLAKEIVERTGIVQGYALVLGQSDCELAAALARQTDLHLLSLVPSVAAAERARTKLIKAGLYGTRVAVDVIADDKHLPYASYFADLVLVAGDQVDTVSRADLFRMVHPSGGVLCLAEVTGETARNLGIDFDASMVVVARGPLPGAADWRYPWADAGKSGIGKDRLVQPPFEMLWFGGPGPAPMMSRHWGVSAPLAVGSRLFVTGQHSVLAIDAYNGRQLWSQPLRGAGRKYAVKNASNFVADGSSLYVASGPVCQRLDQATGQPSSTYLVPKLAGPDESASEQGLWGYVSVAGDLILGSRLRADVAEGGNEGIGVFALDKASGQPRWTYRAKRTVVNTAITLGHDRMILLDATAPAEAGQAQRRGGDGQVVQTLVALDLESGQEIWRQDDVPAGKYDIRWSKGVVVVGAVAGYDAATGKKLWQHSVWHERPPLLHDDWVIAQPHAYHLRTGKIRMTTDLLTDVTRPWAFARAYGCGPVAGCQNMLFFRSGTVGVFDFASGGTSTIGGVRPGCSVTMVAAAGLLLVPEGAGGCSCSYNFQTCVALAPVKEKAGTWFALQGTAPTARVKHLHLNLGAPGDRHDANQRAWLGFPRPVMQRAAPVPVRVDGLQTDGLQTDRLQTDGPAPQWYYESASDSLASSDRPWLYSSGLRGAAKLTIQLQQHPQLEVPVRSGEPKIDGKLDDPLWQNLKPIPLDLHGYRSMPRLDLQVCRDAENLYIAYRRQDETRQGQAVTTAGKPWGASGARPLKDEYLKVYPTDAGLKRIIEYRVVRDGARSDNLYRPRIKEADTQWQGKWRSAVSTQDSQWTAELAIPLADLSDVGLDPNTLLLNVAVANFSGFGPRELWLTGHARWPLGGRGDFRQVVSQMPDPGPPRPYTVRLYFAEPDAAAPGERRFEVRIQGQLVLDDFDIAAESAGQSAGIVKTFPGILLTDQLIVELVPKPPVAGADRSAPILCGLEVIGP